MKSILFFGSVLALCAGCLGAGYVFGGSNLGIMGYAKFSGHKPSRPFSRDDYSRRSYQNDVEQYISDAKEYVENARNDKIRIDNATEEAIDSANNVVDEYNSWVQLGY